MMTSDALKRPEQVYVWIWLPGNEEPVPCGVLRAVGNRADFAYGRRYIERMGAISVYDDLPLKAGAQQPRVDGLASSLRDALPDRWGRRVLLHEMTGQTGADLREDNFDELALMLASGSDRIGALDFQTSPDTYEPRSGGAATLEELQAFADYVAAGKPVPRALDRVILHGSSIGGARPKALLDDPTSRRKLIAKFSASNDVMAMVKAEALAMRLAALAGLSVAPVEVVEVAGRDVILVERFDRTAAPDGNGTTRRAMVSALTWSGEAELSAHHIAYTDLADILRKSARNPKRDLRELFRRMVFNILVGNTDDHARNHAAFWDGRFLDLTREANQALNITPGQRRSLLVTCLEAAPAFQLSQEAARAEIDQLVEAVRQYWDEACETVSLPDSDRAYLAGRHFLNAFAFEGYGTAPVLA
jgi:serine/threonine-protein kinase HipA